ncbi:MAG: arginine--tRNA ligase [Microgenomates group bacterium]
MKFIVDKKVFEKFPDLVVAIPIILGFDNHKSVADALEFLRNSEVALRNKFTLQNFNELENVTAYEKCFSDFGSDPKVFMPAHVALSRRVLEGGQIPNINPMVNLYNGFSIAKSTPFGGEDLDTVYGNFRLFFANGGEKWFPIGGKKSKEAVKGELVWGDDKDLSTRALNWRQCERTKLTSGSKNGYFVMDGFKGVNNDLIKNSAEEFVSKVKELFGGKSEILWLDRDHSVAEIDFVTKNIEEWQPQETPVQIKQEKKYYFLAKQIFEATKAAVNHPTVEKFGDYAVRGNFDLLNLDIVEKVDKVAGFSNIWIKNNVLVEEAENILNEKFKNELSQLNAKKKVMVEFAHPNTHKELHVGHMRTLITGESLGRIFETTGAKVFRANYQGDIGPHVAKALWGVMKLFKANNEDLESWQKKTNAEKAHFLGKAYALGCTDYENENKAEIDEINQKLYQKDKSIWGLYQTTRQWSLNYYEEFYARFYTKFDSLFFESQISEIGKQIVLDNLGKVFEKGDEGAIVFDGSKYGLHKRVFITGAGTVTYEGKEMGLAVAQRKEFAYDKNIHVVGNEQSGYFRVVIQALELLDPWYKDRQYHLPMGMVNLVGKKMSSRTGDIVTVDSILDETKDEVRKLIKEGVENKDEVAEKVTIGAVKFSVLRSDPTQNSIFDIKKSIDLNGNSGPYLQYTFARCTSVLQKTKVKNKKTKLEGFDENEMPLLRYFYIFNEKIVEAAERYSPAVIAEYLLNLARKYNEFYAKCRIIGEPEEERRLFLTAVSARILKTGLNLLGIETLEKM